MNDESARSSMKSLYGQKNVQTGKLFEGKKVST